MDCSSLGTRLLLFFSYSARLLQNNSWSISVCVCKH